MRIEIMMGDSEEPLIQSLKKSKTIIGSGNASDVIVNDIGVSRKHLVIEYEDEKYFVVDQGSTNGTFINDERLVPGRRIEFTSFFPVRLGANVLLTLLSEENDFGGSDLTNPSFRTGGSDTHTKVVSLKDLKKASTKTLAQKREQSLLEAKAKTKAKTKDGSRMTLVTVVILAMIGYALYETIFNAPIPKPPEVIAKVGEPVKVAPKPEVPKGPAFLIENEDLMSKEMFSVFLSDLKCTTDTEKFLCDNYPNAQSPWGVYQRGKMLVVLVDAAPFIAEAKTLLVEPVNPDDRPKYEDDVRVVAGFLSIYRGFSKDLDLEPIKDLNVTVALFLNQETGKEVYGAVAFKPSVIKEIHAIDNEWNLKNLRRTGPISLTPAQKFYRMY